MAVILRSHLYLTLQTGWSEASNTCRDHARCIGFSIVRANHQAALEGTQKTPLTPVSTAQFTQDVERRTLVLVGISVRLLAPVGSATATSDATVPRAGAHWRSRHRQNILLPRHADRDRSPIRVRPTPPVPARLTRGRLAEAAIQCRTARVFRVRSPPVVEASQSVARPEPLACQGFR